MCRPSNRHASANARLTAKRVLPFLRGSCSYTTRGRPGAVRVFNSRRCHGYNASPVTYSTQRTGGIFGGSGLGSRLFAPGANLIRHNPHNFPRYL
jgi:hypothetical protein